MAAEWNVDKTLQFIEDYRQHTVLWCAGDKNYKNREMRRDALQILGEKYSLNSKAVLNKIKSLRSYFHREHSKVIKKKSGCSTEETYQSSWFGYKSLVFILDGNDIREGKDPMTTFNESLVSLYTTYKLYMSIWTG